MKMQMKIERKVRSFILWLFIGVHIGCLEAAEISGCLLYDNGTAVTGGVSVGVVSDANDPLLSAVGNVIKTGRQTVRIVQTDTNGFYLLSSVPEGTNVLLMADEAGIFGPTLTTQLNLSANQVISNINFTFPTNPSGATNITGRITINNQPSTNEVDGSVSITKSDLNIGSMSLWGKHPTDQYAFSYLSPGSYKLRACYAQNSNTVICVSTNVSIPSSGSITVNLNISTP
jgi:hypothetical protein